MQNAEDRNRTIIKYNIAGIVMNLLLAVLKITAGIVARAHAVMLDGVNSLSDMISSLLTILSSYIAGKRGTKDHPLGYGRLEYISSFVVTVIIMYVGAKTLVEAVKTIIHPHDPPEYSPLVVAIMVVSLVCKIAYGIAMRKNGRRLDSDAMIMTGTESLGDALVSLDSDISCDGHRHRTLSVHHHFDHDPAYRSNDAEGLHRQDPRRKARR